MDASTPPKPGDVTDRNLALELVRVTEAAALAASRWIGLGKKNEADGAAVEAMRKAFDTVAIDGTVVIGEGEMDEAPMLFIGEKVGAGGPQMDIAVDPLEGTTLTAKGGPAALAVVALAEHGNFLHAPDIYMDKIAVGGGLPEGVVDLDAPVASNLRDLAQAKKMRRVRPGRLHPRPRPPQGADRQGARGRRAHHADQRRRRERRGRDRDAGIGDRHLPRLRRRAGGRAGRRGAALHRRADAGPADVRERRCRSSG